MKLFSPLLLILIITISCSSPPASLQNQITNIDYIQNSILIKNNFPINNIDGHIQGVQVFKHGDKRYYFFSGSSDSLSYYAIADAERNEVIALDTFLTGAFRHAGGFQIMDNLLAVGIEDNQLKDKSKVQLYEITDPEKPHLELLKTIERSGAEKRYTAGCVGLTRQNKNILIAVGNWDAKDIDFYSLVESELKNSEANFTLIHSFTAERNDRKNWVDTAWHSYQNINLFSDSDGMIYLAGTAQKDTLDIELIDLFSVMEPKEQIIDFKKTVHHQFIKSGYHYPLKMGWRYLLG